MTNFSKCTGCGKIFPQQDGATKCSACRGEAGAGLSQREMLRLVKNHIRDLMARGEFVTMAQVSQTTGVDIKEIWSFIESGEIDLTPFDDPQVRNFMVNKRREQSKLQGDRPGADRGDSSTQRDALRPSGFHSNDKDESGR